MKPQPKSAASATWNSPKPPRDARRPGGLRPRPRHQTPGQAPESGCRVAVGSRGPPAPSPPRWPPTGPAAPRSSSRPTPTWTQWVPHARRPGPPTPGAGFTLPGPGTHGSISAPRARPASRSSSCGSHSSSRSRSPLRGSHSRSRSGEPRKTHQSATRPVTCAETARGGAPAGGGARRLWAGTRPRKHGRLESYSRSPGEGS